MTMQLANRNGSSWILLKVQVCLTCSTWFWSCTIVTDSVYAVLYHKCMTMNEGFLKKKAKILINKNKSSFTLKRTSAKICKFKIWSLSVFGWQVYSIVYSKVIVTRVWESFHVFRIQLMRQRKKVMNYWLHLKKYKNYSKKPMKVCYFTFCNIG